MSDTLTVSRHGTETCYVNGRCRLPECREAHRKARARRELLMSRGVRQTVPAVDVWPHLERLLGEGWSAAQIEVTAGVRRGQVAHVRAGKKVRLRSARLLLAVGGAPEVGRLSNDLTMRRVRSMQALGYRWADIRELAGLPGKDFHIHYPYTSPDTARAILRAYRAVGDTPGPSARTRAHAARQGWLVPASWDDPGTLAWPSPDRPQTEVDVVDEVAVRRVLDGNQDHRTLNDAERVELVRMAARVGVSRSDVMRLLHLSGTSMYRLLEAAGL